MSTLANGFVAHDCEYPDISNRPCHRQNKKPSVLLQHGHMQQPTTHLDSRWKIQLISTSLEINNKIIGLSAKSCSPIRNVAVIANFKHINSSCS